MLSIICILGKNNAIGYKNKLLWDIPDDLEHFKKITGKHTVVMGKKTFKSIGHALPNRLNVIITRDKNYKAEGCKIVHSIEDILEIAKQKKDKEIFIIGGGQIYKQFLPYADKLYLTLVDDEPKRVDTFFPDYSDFKKLLSEEKKEYKRIKYKFVELIK
ncbi:MAG: dihydrofolate reductase [Xanthomonadaceae bacterium]|nr:dihydrofolate reductase [Rhodospirillaceae bacterium]NIA18131.1 dihydrofolate reductase [Xanthomonadaceae bacterium]